ncbi:beta-lactamase class A [Alkalihalobacillus xiaoxiensis]|uniref:Beta-lactamase n=1 Tax=Shouchella xiaoxiensis TaxID=766895 RepID=A0ABS2SRK5_9BACI|nr:class A beta-lactamase [Shouchella xiaoxiensis]MBM7837144.1 beta-lactamase class A [Shouchella xiaoxiensis]
MKRYGAIFTIIVLAACGTPEPTEQGEKQQPEQEETAAPFSELEDKYGARLGVYALDTGDGTTVAYNEDDRFAYASTHKTLAVGVMLQQLSLEELDSQIRFTEADLVTYSPITEQHLDTGMTLREISDASIRYSDNTAANLVFNEIGGPAGFKEALRAIGDDITEPERMETELNDVNPGETRDTSSAKALAESLYAFSLGDALDEERQTLLNDWLIHNTTGDALIRAGVPDNWIVGDKTGSASHGTRNDIGILWPPDEDPIVIAVLSSKDLADAESDDALIAEATEAAVRLLMDDFE